MQRSCADVNSPYQRKCWINAGGPLVNSLGYPYSEGIPRINQHTTWRKTRVPERKVLLHKSSRVRIWIMWPVLSTMACHMTWYSWKWQGAEEKIAKSAHGIRGTTLLWRKKKNWLSGMVLNGKSSVWMSECESRMNCRSRSKSDPLRSSGLRL
jgi:hypothetical protein